MAEQQYIAIALKADVFEAMFPDQFDSFGLRGGEGEHGMYLDHPCVNCGETGNSTFWLDDDHGANDARCHDCKIDDCKTEETGQCRETPETPALPQDRASLIAGLESARECMAKAGVLAKGAPAQDSDGRRVHVTSNNATAFSIYGALMRAIPEQEVLDRATMAVLHEVSRITTMSAGDWNDSPSRTLEDVLTIYDRAIATQKLQARYTV